MEIRFKFTKHAVQRIEEMLVTPEEVKACLEDPAKVYKSKSKPGALNRKRDWLTLTTMEQEDGAHVVITALWSTDEDWRKDIETHGGYEGRTEAKRIDMKQRRT